MVMLLSDWYLDRREKRIQTAKAEGIAEGKAEVYREISDSASETVKREVAEARGPRRTDSLPPRHGDLGEQTLAAEARGPRRTGACCVSSTVGWVERMPSKP